MEFLTDKKKNKWDFSPDAVPSFSKINSSFDKTTDIWEKTTDIWNPKKKKE